jgi:glyoxylase-like metal-dependent hydrolase (beta-lactamase superfamily II)
MADTRYRMTLLRAGRLLLDGGGMFGLIPRVVWSRAVQADDKGRIELAHNCLLLEEVLPADAAPSASPRPPRRIIIETGTGDKLDPKMRSIFGLEDRTVETALREAGGDPATITDVIVSHLHFDHAGGLTRRAREGEDPDWGAGPMSGDATGVKLTFPAARVHVQRQEWDDAIANRSVMTRTYFPDHLEPIREEGRLELCDAPAPFPPGHLPGRDENPLLSLEMREREILPGIHVFLVPGHTWGQQAVRFTEADGRQMVFTPDVMPTAWHVGAAYSLAYDVEPYTSMVTRRWFLGEAADRGWTLALDHEPQNPLRTVSREGKWFSLSEA